MASISTDPTGLKRIVFIAPFDDGKQKTIYLGHADKKTAAGILLHVERLIEARTTGQGVTPDTAGWLNTIGNVLHKSWQGWNLCHRARTRRPSRR